jgi:hypothetical protein
MLQQSQGSRELYGFTRSTWEFNPNFTRKLLEHKFQNDPVKFERDFGANPPHSSAPSISSPALIIECFTEKKSNLIKFYHSIADILFITLKSGESISSTVPGKFQTYLSCNKYILGFIEGETKNLIEEIKIGSVVHPDDYMSLAKEILRLENNRSLLKIENNIGTSYLKENFDKDKVLNNLVDKFNLVYGSYEKIKLIQKLNNSFYKSNFILSGLNLAFLGFLGVDELKLRADIYHWPDGIFSKSFLLVKLLIILLILLV